jgi:hypothetical protein
MIFGVLGVINPRICKLWLSVKVYTSAQSLINYYTSRAYGHERPWNIYIKDDSCCVKMLIYLSFMVLH